MPSRLPSRRLLDGRLDSHLGRRREAGHLEWRLDVRPEGAVAGRRDSRLD